MDVPFCAVDDSGDSDSEDDDHDKKDIPCEKESKAAEEISALVNYVQAVHFHGFDQAEGQSGNALTCSPNEGSAILVA